MFILLSKSLISIFEFNFILQVLDFLKGRGISEPLILTNFENEKVLNDIFLVAGN
jgi:hypothetical protein